MLAPTGVDKTTFGLVLATYLLDREGERDPRSVLADLDADPGSRADE